MSKAIKTVYNTNMKDIRTSNGKDTTPPEVHLLTKKELEQDKLTPTLPQNIDVGDANDLKTKDMMGQYVYAVIMRSGKCVFKDIQDATHYKKMDLRMILDRMEKAKLIEYVTLSTRGHPRLYNVVESTPIPKSWGSKDAIKGMKNPVAQPEIDIVYTDASRTTVMPSKKAKDPSDNALTRLMSKTDRIPMNSEESYRKFLMDLNGLRYGIREIDDLIKEIENTIQSRLDSVDYRCPVCNTKVVKKVTEASCPKCDIKLDCGDFKKALEMFPMIAKMKKGGVA